MNPIIRWPEVHKHEGIYVVRDDLLPGGTKRRILPYLIAGNPADEFVYASPAYGYAQIALAFACADWGKRATVFTAARKTPHRRTLEAKAAGAEIRFIPHGYLNVVQARAREYAKARGAHYFEFGFDDELFINRLAVMAHAAVSITPEEVWCVAGSGTLCRALQRAWPQATHHAVQIGRAPDVGRATLHVAPEKFEQDAQVPPPFPSCTNYDAKAWRYIKQHARPGALFWNVGA